MTKLIVLVGHYSRDDLLLQVLSEKSNLGNIYGYQIIKSRRGACFARKLEPKLKDVSPEEALQAADLIIALEPLQGEILKLVQGRTVVSIMDIAETNPESLRPTMEIELDESWFPDVLRIISEISLTGYRFFLRSLDPELDRLLALTQYRVDDAPLEIQLRCRPGSTASMETIRHDILNFLRNNIRLFHYYTQIVNQYQTRWERNLHWIQHGQCAREADSTGRYETERKFDLSANTDKTEKPDSSGNINTHGSKLFLSCSRTVWIVSERQRQILDTLRIRSACGLFGFPRGEVESVVNVCSNEDWMARRIDALLHTGLAKIENMNDVIVSFLGSRRCNLKCKYCFSDHTCEALSTMSANDILEITEMLTTDKPNLNLHADNNLGGEPWKDLCQVKQRHNAILAYHKTHGCRASFGLLTNGTLMEESDLPWFRCHIPYLGFSLDGDKVTHDKIRLDAAGKPTYDRTVRGIQLLQNADWPVPTGVSCVISRYNLDITGLQAHIRDELDVPNIVMKPVRAALESDFALTYSDLELLKGGYRDFFNYLMKEGENGNLKPLFTMLQPLDYAGRFFIRVFLRDRLIVKRCGSGEHIFSVDDSGRVYPCDSFNGGEDMEIGNIEEGMHNRFGYHVPFVCDEKKEFGCDNCWARFLCGGICQYVQYLNQYEHNDVTRMECGLAKFLIESAIRFWDAARENWNTKSLEQVAAQIRNIGFSPMLDRNAFVYAPC